MAKKEVDLAALERKVKKAADNHSNVRATLTELFDLVVGAYSKPEAKKQVKAPKPVDAIGTLDD